MGGMQGREQLLRQLADGRFHSGQRLAQALGLSRAAADPQTESGRVRAWLAEHQTAGRGRRGRSWVSSFGENLYLSVAWRFDLPMGELAGLSIVAGVVVAEALQRLGLEGHTLKWPNDVLVDGRKLSGISASTTSASRSICASRNA